MKIINRLFDDQYEVLHDREEISKVNNLTENEYCNQPLKNEPNSYSPTSDPKR